MCLIPSLLLLFSLAPAAQASYRFTTNYGDYRSDAPRFAVPSAFAARAAPAAPVAAPAPATALTYEAHPEPVPSAFAARAVPAVPSYDSYESLPLAAAPAAPAAPVAAPAPAAALTYEAHPEPVPEPYTFAAPAEPVAAAAVHASQYHAQDELGHVEYGYSNPNSQKQESRDAYGNVHGAYRQEPYSLPIFTPT